MHPGCMGWDRLLKSSKAIRINHLPTKCKTATRMPRTEPWGHYSFLTFHSATSCTTLPRPLPLHTGMGMGQAQVHAVVLIRSISSFTPSSGLTERASPQEKVPSLYQGSDLSTPLPLHPENSQPWTRH